MPPVVRVLTYVIPLRYCIASRTASSSKGVGWTELRDEAAILLVYGIIFLGLATAFFRKQVR